MDSLMQAHDLIGTGVQSFRGIWINFAVTDMSLLHHEVVHYRSSCFLGMLLAQENVNSLLAAIVVATEDNARCTPGCQPPSVDKGKCNRLSPVPVAWSMPAYLDTLAAHPAFNIFNGFSIASRMLA